MGLLLGPRSDRRASFMNAFAAAEHVQVLGKSAGAGFGALGVVEAPDDRVAVARVEFGERRGEAGLGVECLAEVVRHAGAALSGVGGVPPAVRLGALDLGQAGWM